MSIHQGYITLTLYGQNEQYATLIDIADWDKVKDYRWCVKTNDHRSRKYRYAFRYENYINADGKARQRTIYLHRFLLDAPKTLLVDHKNHDTLDNRRSNLRLATRSTNGANSRQTRLNRFGYRGVDDNNSVKYPFVARIRVNDQSKYIGAFPTLEEAARAYDRAAYAAFGEFAVLNFPDEVK